MPQLLHKNLFFLLIFFFVILFSKEAVFNLGRQAVFADESAAVEATAKISVCGNSVAEGGEHCDLTDLRSKSCTDLGFDSGDLTCYSCEFDTSTCVTNATASASAEFSANSGGENELIDSNNSAKITLLENFYTKDVTLQMFSYDKSVFETSKPAPSGKSFIGKTYNFVFINPDGDTVSTLSKSATFVLIYTDADVSGIDESTLAPYHYDGNLWQLISGSAVDAANNKVTFSTANFSSFALFGEPAAEAEAEQPTPSGGGGGGFFRRIFKPTPEPKPTPVFKPTPDFNKDGKINIIDLSILLFWFGKTGSEIVPYDLNEDSKIDIVDVSILFYHWKD